MTNNTKVSPSDFPFKYPYVVRNGWGFVALFAVIMMIPVTTFVFLFGIKLLVWLNNHTSLNINLANVPWWIPLMISGILVTNLPLYFVYRRTAKYYLKCVKWYLDNDRYDSAKTYVRLFSHVIGYRDWKKNNWLRDFVRESNLISDVPRLSKFNRRYPA